MINHLLAYLHLGRECFGLFLPNIFKVYTVLTCYMIFHHKDANTGIIWLKLQIRWNSKATQTLSELGNVGRQTLIMCFTICCCWGKGERCIAKVALGSGGPHNTQQLQKGANQGTKDSAILAIFSRLLSKPHSSFKTKIQKSQSHHNPIQALLWCALKVSETWFAGK